MLILNTEDNDNEMEAVTDFMNRIEELSDSCVVAVFVGERPAPFSQFQMRYIPHTSVIGTNGRLIANAVDPGEAIEQALS